MAKPRRSSPVGELEARFLQAVRSPLGLHTYPMPSRPVAGAPADLHAGGGPASLYVHLPYCSVRCTYCFFVTQIGLGADDMRRYVDELEQELGLAEEAMAAYQVTSLYYGGGTPGLLPAPLFERLHGLVAPSLAPDATITVETHPHAADRSRIAAWRAAGVDRVSMGVQTLDGDLLELINRGLTRDHIRPAIHRLLLAEFADVNVDLLYGLPGQEMDTWLETLDEVIALGVPSISIYRTAFVPHTLAAFAKRDVGPPPAARCHLMYERAYERLNTRGYRQPRFGSSTFSRLEYPFGLNEHRRHVLAGKPMLGLGMGAYGTTPGYAYANQRERAPYQADVAQGRLPVLAARPILPEERPHKYAVETWKLGFLSRVAYARQFQELPEARFGAELALLVGMGQLEQVETEYRLTRNGARHPDAIAELFLSEAARQQVRP